MSIWDQMLDNYCQKNKKDAQTTGWEEIPEQNQQEPEKDDIKDETNKVGIEATSVKVEAPYTNTIPEELIPEALVPKAVFPEISKETATTVKAVKIKKADETANETANNVKTAVNNDKKSSKNFVSLNETDKKRPGRPCKNKK